MHPNDPLAPRLENRLKMRHYALLLAFDRHRSVTGVARQLSLSQPTVTRALADIEDIFMQPLFLRTRRGLEPTAAGEVVVARARLAIADNEALLRELEGVREGWQGRLRIGLIPYVSPPALDALWKHLFDLRPRLLLYTQEDTTGPLLNGLRDRTLDCAICRFSSASTEDDLEQVLLYRQQAHLVVAGPSAGPLMRHAALDIAQLSDMDWIFPPTHTPIRQMIDATFSAAGQRVPVPALEAYAVRTISSALLQMPRGVTVLPGDVARAVAAGGAAEMLPQPLPWNLPPVGLAWLKGAPKAKICLTLSGAIREHLQSPGEHPEQG